MRFLILILLTVNTALAQMTATQKQDVPAVSIIPNSGFENGRAGYVSSGGTFASVTSGSNLLDGLSSVTWDSNAASQTLRSPQVAIPEGLKAKNGQLFCSFKPAATGATHILELWDGTTASYSTTIRTVDTSTALTTNINFVFPTSGNIGWRVRSVASNEPLIAIDDCYLGSATNLTSVAQNALVVSAFKAGTTSCLWSRSGTSYGDFGTVSACPAITIDSQSGIGTVVTTDDDLPQIVINDLPAGTYKVSAAFSGTYDAGSPLLCYRLSDGTTGRGEQCNQTDGTITTNYNLIGTFTYTTAGNRTFRVQGLASVNSVRIFNDASVRTLQFIVERMPSASEIVATLNSQNYDWTSYTPTFTQFGTVTSPECYHARDGGDLLLRCKFTTGTVGSGEARVSLPNNLTSKTTASIPTIQVVGQWARGAASSSNYGSILIEPSTAYVTFGAVYAAAANPFTKLNGTGVAGGSENVQILARVPIAGWDNAMPVPVFVGSVASGGNSPFRIETATITNNGSACAVSYESSDWIGTVSRPGTGQCSLPINSGIWSSIGSVSCSCTMISGTANGHCNFNQASPLASPLVPITINGSGSATDQTTSIICMGPR